MAIHGMCDARFQAVRDEFERNFAERGEVGASVCVMIEGRTVVDLWGGFADRHTRRPWERDTIVLVWSSTKGATALCAHMLISRGLLDLDGPVASYWPEFGQAGKDSITVRMLLNHQAGLPAIRQPLVAGGLYDWPYMTGVLAAEMPFWEPGTRQGYHATTFGHLVGEVVRRVSGKPFEEFFRDEVARPLGLDFHIGLAEEHEPRVAPIIRADPPPADEPRSRFLTLMAGDPESIQALTVKNTGRRSAAGDHDSCEAHRAVLPSQGGITNARGLAGMYAPLAQGGGQLVDAVTLKQMSAVSSAIGIDATLLIGLRISLGFWKSSDNRQGPPGARDSMILSEEAFGHPGMGGSLGFADTGAKMSFGYTMNKQGRGVCLNERGQSLVDAVYRALGYGRDRLGRWM
ncbi:MAG TPA: serine hydrolase domain-containing protein [Gemmataceae bacterium]|nr:serine hydrolase domain-containing protein [Gemmataceae bacterium]